MAAINLGNKKKKNPFDGIELRWLSGCLEARLASRLRVLIPAQGQAQRSIQLSVVQLSSLHPGCHGGQDFGLGLSLGNEVFKFYLNSLPIKLL